MLPFKAYLNLVLGDLDRVLGGGGGGGDGGLDRVARTLYCIRTDSVLSAIVFS